VCASSIVSKCDSYIESAKERISAAPTAGRYSEAALPLGVLPQRIMSSSGVCTVRGEGLISKGCIAGDALSSHAIFRCASLSD
jgi:hypothetical protein